MRVYRRTSRRHAWPPCCCWLVCTMSIGILRAVSALSPGQNRPIRHAEEYIMTSAPIDGIKRSNVCGDGYRIEGALLKSYPFTKGETYLPDEDCSMTFQARRPNNRLRIRILTLDLNDIHRGVDCLDSLRFYQSAHMTAKTKLNTVECDRLTESNNFNIVSPTDTVTAHFKTDGGNVRGLGFKVVLTSFRSSNKTHPCDADDDEYRCFNGECISSTLLCDNVPHCLDGSDEIPHHSCVTNSQGVLSTNDKLQSNSRLIRINEPRHWRGILIVAFLLIIFIAFVLFMAYVLCRRCLDSPAEPLHSHQTRNYATIVNAPLAGSKKSPTTELVRHEAKSGTRLDDDYNLI